MSCVAGFGASAFALAVIMRHQFLVWMCVRALAIGLLALTFPPVGTMLFPASGEFWIARLAATDVVVGVTGPLLATYIEPRIVAPMLRRALWALLPASLVLAFATPLLVTSPSYYWLHNLIVLGLIVTLLTCLVIAIVRGSRTARFQAAAWAPTILIGFIALYFELVLLRSMPFYAESMLAAFLLEFVITASGIGDGFVLIRQELDKAVLSVREATRASTLDPLTGIANRRGLAQRFDNPEAGRPTGIAVIDCDHFKRINDNFGHDVGDDALVAVAEALQGDGLFIGRLGGEEFVVLIYASDWEQRAENARRRVDQGVRLRAPQLGFRVTASAGLSWVNDGDTLESAVKRADRALYAAKDAGRDRSLLLTENAPGEARLAQVG